MNSDTHSFDDLDDETREAINNVNTTRKHPGTKHLPTVNTTPLVITLPHQITDTEHTTLADELSNHEFSCINEDTTHNQSWYSTTLVDKTDNGIWKLYSTDDRIVIYPNHPDHYHKPTLARIIHIIDDHVTDDDTTITVTNYPDKQ